jgi:(E)-4-hydroxy-3-methylbut-2-enyl-diphosphate synthase
MLAEYLLEIIIPISVQSMTNTNTCDVLSTINQINDLQAAGADIVRVSVPGFR